MKRKRISRREFFVRTGTAVGGLIVASCGKYRGGDTAPTGQPNTLADPISTPAVVASPTPAPTPDLTGAPDILLTNGKVITVDSADTIAQAVAIKGGHIQQVGDSEQLAALADGATRVIDLAGRAVTPGMIDSHNHLQIMGLMEGHFTSFIPPEVRSMTDIQAKLEGVTAQHPAGEWIQGYYLGTTEGRLPTRYDLDPASPDHPVWIMQMGGHYASANSRAMELAGITKGVKSPDGGYIEVDDDGEPTGIFYNHRAMDMLRRAAPVPTAEQTRQNIVSVQPLFAAVGMTSYHDNNVRSPETIQSYIELSRMGEMYLRGAVFYTLEWPNDLDRALKELNLSYADATMRFAGFKFLLDGQVQMSYCHEPHSGVRWDMPTWDPKTFKQAVRALHDTGLQISVHCIGDAAADLTLDAYEEAMNANPRPDPRHRIEHLVLTKPDTTLRMRDLGVIASVQPQFIRLGGDFWPGIYGPGRGDRYIVTREWLDNGVHVALGSDAPTTPWYNPQVTLAGAVARPTITGKILLPEQAMTIEEAVRAHTMGSAYALFEEDIKGSLEYGKLADLIVWAHDPYTSTIEDHGAHPIDITMIGGEIVFQT